VYAALSFESVVFLDVAQCGIIVNRRFRGTRILHLWGRKITRARKSVRQLLTDYYSSEALKALIIASEGVEAMGTSTNGQR
jgi:hypothetical protein